MDTACVDRVDFNRVRIEEAGVDELQLKVTAITPPRLLGIEANIAIVIVRNGG